jgi:hypothetical protein
LNISSAFTSVITIYIVIPFILIPQLLFSGVLVKFDKLHLSSSSSREYVPVIGDLMPARWAFEALAVKQFKDNEYEKHFFKSDMMVSQNSYYCMLIDKLNDNLWRCKKLRDSIDFRDLVNESFRRLNWHINELAGLSKINPGPWKSSLNAEKFNPDIGKNAGIFLDSLKKHYLHLTKQEISLRDTISSALVKAIGIDGRVNLMDNYENKRLKDMVLDRDNPDQHKTIETGYKIIRKYEPGYMKATSKYGRAHFYAPIKMLWNKEIDTFWFNLLVLWFVTLVLYIILYFNLLQKVVSYFENLRFAKTE